MQLFLDCYPCLLRQVLQAARIASTDEATQARIMDEAMLTLTQHHTFTTAPALAQTMHEIVQRHSGRQTPTNRSRRGTCGPRSGWNRS